MGTHIKIELEKIIKEVRKEYCFDSIKIDVSINDESGVGLAELSYNDYKNNIFNIIFYRPIEEKNIKEKEIIVRHELMHLQDVIDSKFSFDYEYIKGNIVCSGDDRLKKQFEIKLVKLFWDISIVMRLKKRSSIDDPYDIDHRINDFISANSGSFKCRFNGMNKDCLLYTSPSPRD